MLAASTAGNHKSTKCFCARAGRHERRPFEQGRLECKGRWKVQSVHVRDSTKCKEFFELVKSIGESRSKQEEDKIIVGEIAILKQHLSAPNITAKKMKDP